MLRLLVKLESIWNEQRGSVLGEYGVWIALVVVVAAAALTPLGNQIKQVFKGLCTALGGTAC